MRKELLIVLLFVSASLFAQDKNEFFVKNNGDTVYCDIKTVNDEPGGPFGTGKIKNDLLYVSPNNGEKIIDFKEIVGYKRKKQVFLWKKIFIDINGSDTIYKFFPNNTGKYKYAAVIVLVKDSIKFYRETYGSGKYIYYRFLVEKGNDKILYLLPVADNFASKNKPDTWLIMKKACSDNSDIVAQMDKYYSEKKRCNYNNIQEVIASYTGMQFDNVPKVPKVE